MEKTFKARLRFMFHYCFTQGDDCKTAYLPAVFDLRKAQPAAAIKARLKTNKHDFSRLIDSHTTNRHYSWLFVLCRGCSPLFLWNRLCSLAFSKCLWHSSCEMCIAKNRPPELTALVEALTLRRGVFQLKGRLLKAVRSELQAAKGSGLTWRVIWGTLREEGYPGGYQQFCKAANRAIEGIQPRITRKAKNLPPPAVGKEVYQPNVRESRLSTENTEDKEKPAWQVQREEAMAKLDREAELNRQRELRLKPTKVFKPSVFVGRSEN